jgi:hypothetical protein
MFLLKILTLKKIMNRLAFYFSFEKNKKNLVDLINLILIIYTTCHFFALLWHGLAIYEIKYLGNKDTWIHA